MRALHFLFLLVYGLLSAGCNGPKNSDPKPEDLAVLQAEAIPEDAIPFHYLNDSTKYILLDAVLNGTDSIVVIWDTGVAGMTVPTVYDSCLKKEDSICLKIGHLDLKYKGEIRFSDRFNLKDGSNRMITGKGLFKDQIVEISYDRKYLRVLDNVDGLEGYERIPYKEIDGDLCILLSLCIQGKVFHIEDAIIDTGFNGAFITNENYLPGVDLTKSFRVYGILSQRKKMTGHMITADTIRTGGVYASHLNICIASSDALVHKKTDFSNLLGNEFFSHFSVVFDFKNQDLYLKPLEQ